jgi:hypothetical protein
MQESCRIPAFSTVLCNVEPWNPPHHNVKYLNKCSKLTALWIYSQNSPNKFIPWVMGDIHCAYNHQTLHTPTWQRIMDICSCELVCSIYLSIGSCTGSFSCFESVETWDYVGEHTLPLFPPPSCIGLSGYGYEFDIWSWYQYNITLLLQGHSGGQN